MNLALVYDTDPLIARDFGSTGFALEDLVAMRIILRHAQELGLGEALETETSMPNPKNPYSCLAPAAFSLCSEDQQ